MINNLQEKENYKIMFFDEGRFGLRSTVMRVWAEKGKRLSVMVQQGFKNFYGFSSVCPFDGTNYSLLLPGVNTELMQYYIDNLSKEFSDKKIILFMDQAGWHKSRNLQIPENIRFEFLPAYSPELNPVEKLWQWIKKECLHNFIYNSLKELEDAVIVEFQKLTLSKYKKLCNCNYMSYFM